MRPSKILSRLFTAFAVVAITAPSLALADKPRSDESGDGITVEAQPLATALQAFSEQSGLQIAYVATLADNVSSKGTEGADTPVAALSEILESTGLEYQFVNNDTVAIGTRLSDAGSSDLGNSRPVSSPILLAQNQTPVEQEQSPTKSDDDEEDTLELDKIVVTGTHIRGISNVASPSQIFDREAIERSGHSTTERFIQSLPINFNGGASDITIGSNTGGGDIPNTTDGTGINLRGLGNVSTLVLVNGRRSVSSNSGDFVDLSLIPTSAIERIEIVGDGSSAIYGTDAVAGVVNILLRDDYEGAETRVRHGFATQGGLEEYRVGQTLGANWANGGGLVSFEWFDRNNLDANDRPFSEDLPDPFDLLASTRRKSLFATVNQALGERTKMSGYATYATRDSDDSRTFSGGLSQDSLIEVEQYNASLALEHQINSSWVAELSSTYGASELTREELRNDDPFQVFFKKPKLLTVDLKADGGVFSAPGGIAKLAVGGQYRRDEFTSSNLRTGRVGTFDRNVAAVFGEVYIPLVSEQNRVPGVRELEVSAAGRFEDYSDFGSTTNPKVGVRWSPVEGLSIRGTWGESFRAPLFEELDDTGNRVFGVFFPDPASPTGFTGIVLPVGGNPNLGPESATTWSVGLDITDFLIPNLSINLTYFDVTFLNRIADPPGEISLIDAFLLEDELGALLTRVDDPSVQAELFSMITDNFGIVAADIGAFFDARLNNVSGTNMSALDLDIGYALSSGFGDFTFDVSATFTRKLETQLTDSSLFRSQVDTTFQPTDLRLRAGGSWSRAGVTLSGFVNYVDDYTNNRVSPEQPVDSWTTVDLTAAFQIGALVPSAGVFRGLSLQASAINLFDEDPPFIDLGNPASPSNFDGTNANPSGRVVAVELVKRW